MQVYFRAIWNKYKFTKWTVYMFILYDINIKDDVILLNLKEDVEFKSKDVIRLSDFFFNITNTHNWWKWKRRVKKLA